MPLCNNGAGRVLGGVLSLADQQREYAARQLFAKAKGYETYPCIHCDCLTLKKRGNDELICDTFDIPCLAAELLEAQAE